MDNVADASPFATPTTPSTTEDVPQQVAGQLGPLLRNLAGQSRIADRLCGEMLRMLATTEGQQEEDHHHHHHLLEPPPSASTLPDPHPEVLAALLGRLASSASRLRFRLCPLPLSDDILFDLFHCLPRKHLFHTVQLVCRRWRAILLSRRDALWPRFRFGQLIVYTDEDLRRSSKCLLFRNSVPLRPPPSELAPILASIDQRRLPGDNPMQLVVHHRGTATDEAEQPKSVFFFVRVEEADAEADDEDAKEAEEGTRKRSRKCYFQVPNRIGTKLDMGNCLWMFRELANSHFGRVHFGLFRWSPALFDLLPPPALACAVFQTYHPVPVPFLLRSVRPSQLATVWDMNGTDAFFRFLVQGEAEADDGLRKGNRKRVPEGVRAWGFIPQMIVPRADAASAQQQEMTFFDALIHYAHLTTTPDQLVSRIDLKFKQNPAPWPRIIPGMRLIYRAQTMQVDEDAEEGAEAEESVVECRYRMTGVTNTKFEVRVECDPAQADQEMYAFVLIRQDPDEEKES